MTSDLIIVGGGLAGSLAAYRLAVRRPEIDVLLVEQDGRLGGNHTWSCHDTDLPPSARQWTEPLVAARWPGHEVRFAGGARTLSGGYRSITSERLDEVVRSALGDRVSLQAPVTAVREDGVTLAGGGELRARLVIDARGARAVDVPLGWQVFLGQELELERGHGLAGPIIMDATVPQVGGFRFVYVLPWSDRRVLVEDTVYADTPALDADRGRAAIASYLETRGWTARSVLREESGALPIPLGGYGRDFWQDGTVRIGMGAGLFHPTTGYSLPDAAATADLLASLDLRDGGRVYQEVERFALDRWRRRGFYRLLNRLLFRAARPAERARVLEQFYRRSEGLIARFYAGELTWWDRCRVLSGRPPVSVGRALAHLWAR